METIKVNMNPNPLDVQTIHASQNDGEARQWGFELHNNGDAIDSSEITDQMVFKAYKGGTEQILPENTSVPTTSPIIADIQYKDALRSEQEFLYRESPTTVDGKAKITKIKGNTLVWNQLIQNGNFVNGTNNWKASDSSTISASNGELTVTIGAAWNNDARQNRSLVAGHKYLGIFKAKSDTLRNIGVSLGQFGAVANVRFARTETLSSTYQTVVGIATITESTSVIRCSLLTNASSYVGQTYTIKDVMLFDLTQMGLDISNPSDFTSLFPLSYYAYNQGTLLSFMGNGIKTVGKNRLNYDVWKTVETRNGTSVWENNGVTITATSNDAYTLYGASTFPVNARIPVQVGKTITLSWESDDNVNGDVYIFPNGASSGFVSINNRVGKSLSYTPIDGVEYVTIRFGVASSGDTIHFKNIMLRYDGTDPTYEPYTSTTTDIPISTYFPTGMKRVVAYDELTPNKAITRISRVDLGTMNWTYDSTNRRFVSSDLRDLYNYKGQRLTPFKSAVYTILSNGEAFDVNQDMVLYAGGSSDQVIIVQNHSYTDATAFKTAMSNVYLYYELATETETEITSASLVTENAEIPLSNEDGVLIGKCTEQLSSESGFIDAKIKLADEDGECYSNKLQLHVERSPQ